jgi:tetratricopeptide (TPR) repeat protein
MERELGVITSFININVIGVLVVVVGLLLLLRFLYKREGEGISDFRIWFFGLSIFFISLGPTSGIFASINAFLYEHWLYFGLFGIFVIAAFYIDKLWSFVKDRGVWRYVVIGVLVGYFGFFGVAAAKRNLAWGDPMAFYEDIIRYTPDSVRINNNLGNLYNQEEDLEKAEFYYRRAIESEDTFAQPHYNIGVIRMNEGNFEEAKQEYLRAVELNPSFYYAYQNLAFIYANEGDYVGATNALLSLVEIRPNDPAVYYNLGLVYVARNDIENARIVLRKGLEVARTEKEVQTMTQLLTEIE